MSDTSNPIRPTRLSSGGRFTVKAKGPATPSSELVRRLREHEADHLAHIAKMIDEQAQRFNWDAEQQQAELVIARKQAAIAINFRDFQALLALLSTPGDHLPTLKDREGRDVWNARTTATSERDAILTYLKACTPNPEHHDSDFSQGVIRGFEICIAQIECGHHLEGVHLGGGMEAAAKIAEQHADQCDDTTIGRRTNQTARDIAAAIRAASHQDREGSDG